jgi:hypothetical protein
MAGLQETENLKSAEIRIFCDNDSKGRWKERKQGGWKDTTKYALPIHCDITH